MWPLRAPALSAWFVVMMSPPGLWPVGGSPPSWALQTRKPPGSSDKGVDLGSSPPGQDLKLCWTYFCAPKLRVGGPQRSSRPRCSFYGWGNWGLPEEPWAEGNFRHPWNPLIWKEVFSVAEVCRGCLSCPWIWPSLSSRARGVAHGRSSEWPPGGGRGGFADRLTSPDRHLDSFLGP